MPNPPSPQEVLAALPPQLQKMVDYWMAFAVSWSDEIPDAERRSKRAIDAMMKDPNGVSTWRMLGPKDPAPGERQQWTVLVLGEREALDVWRARTDLWAKGEERVLAPEFLATFKVLRIRQALSALTLGVSKFHNHYDHGADLDALGVIRPRKEGRGFA